MHKTVRLFPALMLLINCANPSETVIVNNINGSWNKTAEQQFKINITDAEKPRDLVFMVRNNNDYPYSNLRLIVKLENEKTKKKTVDTLNYILAQPNGEWIGKGFGDTKETDFQYKLNYTFPNNGSYTIAVIQAMRRDILPGIEDLGLTINMAKP